MRARTWALVVGWLIAGCAERPGVAPAKEPIIEGHRARTEEVGATVALVGPWDGYPFCTGTLVSADVVLTAAHCLLGEPTSRDAEFGSPVTPAEVAVVVGAIDAMTASDAQWYEVRAVHVHDAFPGGPPYADDVLTSEHDVGAVVLARDVVGVAPAPLLSRADVARELVAGRALTAAGYGTTDRAGTAENTELHVADLPFVRRSEDELIAGVAGGSDTCYGDSGGPLYLDSGDRLWIAGVTSRAADNTTDRCEGGTVFTLASAYVAWLEDVTGESFAEEAPAPPSPAPVDAGVAPSVRADAGAGPPPAVRDSGARDGARDVAPPHDTAAVSGEASCGCVAARRAAPRTGAAAWLVVAATWVARRRRRAVVRWRAARSRSR